MSLRRIVPLFLALLAAAVPAGAEKMIVKKTGRVLDGNIVERKGDFVKIVHSGGIGWYLLDDLESAETERSDPLAGLTKPDPRAIGYATITAPEIVIPPRVQDYGTGTGLQVFDLVETTPDGYIVWFNHDGTNVLARIARRDRMGNENGELIRGKLKVNPQRTPKLVAVPIVLKRGEEYPVVRQNPDSFEILYRKGSFETTVTIPRNQASYDFLSRELRFAREQRQKGLVFYEGQWVTKEERNRLLAERRTRPKPVSQLDRYKMERRLELARAQKEQLRKLEEAQIRNLKKLQKGEVTAPIPLQQVARPPKPPVRIARLELKGIAPAEGEAVRIQPVVHIEVPAGAPPDISTLTIHLTRFNMTSGFRVPFPDKQVSVPAPGEKVQVAFDPVGFRSPDELDTLGHVVELWNGRSLVDFRAVPNAVQRLAMIAPPGAPPAPAEKAAEEPSPEAPGLMPGMMPGAPPPGLAIMNPELRDRAEQENGIIRDEVQKVFTAQGVRTALPIDVHPDSSGRTILVSVSQVPDRFSDAELKTICRQIIERAGLIQTPGEERTVQVSLQTISGRSFTAP